MFKWFNFALVNVISKKIAVKKYSSPPEKHSHMCTFHELTFTLARDLFTKIFLEWLEGYKKISLLREKKVIVFSIANSVKDNVLYCFLFENIKHFLVKKVISFLYLWHHIILIKWVKFYYEFLKVLFVKLYFYNYVSTESVINKAA